MAKAALLFSFKAGQGRLLMEMVVWQLPGRSADRLHGLKYRLYLGRDGRNLVRYDNEAGKGDHKHTGEDEVEESYRFTTLERLLEDFRIDAERHGWRWER